MIENIYTQIPGFSPEELTQTLIQSGNVRIERIVSFGQASPEGYWYDQQESEWVIVLQGEAKLELQDQPETIHLKRGDFLNIPAHRKHRVLWTVEDRPTIWLAVFYNDDDCPADDQ